MQQLEELKGKDFGVMKAKEFEDLICFILRKSGTIERQIIVPNRGDGRRGKIDIGYYPHHDKFKSVGIEIDRKTPREKSRYKLLHSNFSELWIFTRSPFIMQRI